jgi:dienelactone hydrolase
MPGFVLIHSPVVGPVTWEPVAARLADAGWGVAVPSLLAAGDGDPPFWPRVVAAVAAAVTGSLEGTARDEPLVLVAHSNAGVFLPVIRAALARPVRCSVFADAGLPARAGSTPTASEDFLPFLRGLAGPDGRLPRWTDWWPDDDLSPLFPDEATRKAVTRELPRLPLAYYAEQVPVPPGWDDHTCAYLHFSSAYDAEARQAAQRGWPVRRLPGEHLHQLVDPAGVAAVLLEFGRSPGP